MGFFDNDQEKKDDAQNTQDQNLPAENSSEQTQTEEQVDPTIPRPPTALGMSDSNNNATKYLYRDINGYVRLVENKLLFTPLVNPEDPTDDTFDATQEREIGPDKIGEVRYTEIVSELRERY